MARITVDQSAEPAHVDAKGNTYFALEVGDAEPLRAAGERGVGSADDVSPGTAAQQAVRGGEPGELVLGTFERLEERLARLHRDHVSGKRDLASIDSELRQLLGGNLFETLIAPEYELDDEDQMTLDSDEDEGEDDDERNQPVVSTPVLRALEHPSWVSERDSDLDYWAEENSNAVDRLALPSWAWTTSVEFAQSVANSGEYLYLVLEAGRTLADLEGWLRNRDD